MKRRTYGTNKIADLRIKIEPENRNKLFKKAEDVGVSMSEYIRRIIVTDLAKENQTTV